MKHKYGVIQSTETSCIFYKQDIDGNQSTFNIFATSTPGEEEKKTLFAFIDNEQLRQESWFGTTDINVRDIIEAFNKWAEDAPFLFEMDAQKSMGHCLRSELKQR